MTFEATSELLELLKIEGPPGREERVAAFISDRLRGLGVPADAIFFDAAHRQSEIGGTTGNLIVRIVGRNGGRPRMLSAHMDTIPDAVGAEPYIDGNTIRNKAAGKALGGDNRTGCAVLLHAARKLCPLNGNHAPVTLVFFVQEEIGLVGSRGLDVSKLGPTLPERCYNFDCDKPESVIHAVTGAERFNIQISGKAAHAGAHPEQGISAAVIAALAIGELVQQGWHGRIAKPEGAGSANTGIIHGGGGSNVVMPELQILAEARSHNRAFRAAIVAAWRNAFERAASSVRNIHGDAGAVRFSPGPIYEAFRLDERDAIVAAAVSGLRQIGLTPDLQVNDGGMDANNVVKHGIPCLTLGCGQRDVHTPQEIIMLEHFQNACRLVELLVAAGSNVD